MQIQELISVYFYNTSEVLLHSAKLPTFPSQGTFMSLKARLYSVRRVVWIENDGQFIVRVFLESV